jgi:hypothetical protein
MKDSVDEIVHNRGLWTIHRAQPHTSIAGATRYTNTIRRIANKVPISNPLPTKRITSSEKRV